MEFFTSGLFHEWGFPLVGVLSMGFLLSDGFLIVVFPAMGFQEMGLPEMMNFPEMRSPSCWGFLRVGFLHDWDYLLVGFFINIEVPALHIA
jgi:hypothetical protein